MKAPFKSQAGELFDDSESSDDKDVGPLKTPKDDDDPFPITISRCNKEDMRKSDFTMENDPKYKLYIGSFKNLSPCFRNLSWGFFCLHTSIRKKLKGFYMRCSNTRYHFDGRKERMVDDGKNIILVSIVFGLLVSNNFGISRFSIPRFWLYTVFDI